MPSRLLLARRYRCCYHHPVVLAKRLATIDALSRGQMSLLTVGLGVLPGEAAAAGVDFATRGRRADAAIDVLRLLWDGDAAGRDPAALEYTRWGQIDMTPDVQAYASQGVTRLAVSPSPANYQKCGPRYPHSPAAWGLG